MRLVSVLSSEIALVSTREPVYGTPQHFQQGRDVCLARVAAHALCHVEADIRLEFPKRLAEAKPSARRNVVSCPSVSIAARM